MVAVHKVPHRESSDHVDLSKAAEVSTARWVTIAPVEQAHSSRWDVEELGFINRCESEATDD